LSVLDGLFSALAFSCLLTMIGFCSFLSTFLGLLSAFLSTFLGPLSAFLLTLLASS
jgi:hypothetical protein